MELDTVFETERLLLRPIHLDDADDVYLLTGDPEVMRFANCDVLSLEATKESLRRNISTRLPAMLPLGWRHIEIKETGSVIGDCGLHHLENIQGRPVEISYHIARRHWGQGYATEAAKCLLKHGFSDLELPEIVAAINPDNPASIRVAEKLDLTFKQNVDWPEQGQVGLYSLFKDKYERANQKFEPTLNPPRDEGNVQGSAAHL